MTLYRLQSYVKQKLTTYRKTKHYLVSSNRSIIILHAIIKHLIVKLLIVGP